jgi:hypothetical protein
MLALTTIDLGDLDRVSGGQQRSTNGEATVNTPAGSATVRGGQTVSEPNAYLRCLDLVGRQGGAMEAPNNIERRQQALCPLSLADK